MIVVAGGGGTLGRVVVAELQAAGYPVRVLARDAVAARQALGPDVEVVAADVRRPDDLPAALEGANVVVSAFHGFLGGRGAGPAEVDRDGNAHLIDATARAGAALVLVSVTGAAADSPLELSRMKYAAEEQLRSSGLPWTVIRATPFLETWIRLLRQTAARSGRALVFGRGQQPIAFVSVRDVAAVVVDAATQPGRGCQVVEISGPERLTMVQLAGAVQSASLQSAAVQSAAGRKAPRHLPRPILRMLSRAAAPLSPSFARQNRAAVVLDTSDLTGAARPLAELMPGRRSTTAADLLAVSPLR
jgi:NADH dehydrogenase